MTERRGGASRRVAGVVVLVLGTGAAWALAAGAAFAADSKAAPTAIQELQAGPLLAFTCSDCHASLADTTTVGAVKGVKFSHGAHMSFDCTACHPRFPHTRAGTQVPTEQSCFTCHGLRHGPQGIVASGECSTCHLKPRSQLVPVDHKVPDYAGKGHVAAAKAQLRTYCMRCHDQAFCDACHLRARVSWETTSAYTYDAGNGCLSCHKTELPRVVAPVTESKLSSSAHRDLTCPQCHPDFRYDDKGGATKLWEVNAGLACGQPGCHPKEYAAWAPSVHGQAVLQGTDMTAATCGGCHGGHDIERLNTQAAKDRLYLSGETTCAGTCHTHDAAIASYADWYHGEAYKRGALDAPACWTCHGAHETVPLKAASSMTSPENVAKTCGQAGCHPGSTEAFALAGERMIHTRADDVVNNPIQVLKAALFAGRR